MLVLLAMTIYRVSGAQLMEIWEENGKTQDSSHTMLTMGSPLQIVLNVDAKVIIDITACFI